MGAYSEYYGNTIRVEILLQVSVYPVSMGKCLQLPCIQMYAIYVIGKRPSGPKYPITTKYPWILLYYMIITLKIDSYNHPFIGNIVSLLLEKICTNFRITSNLYSEEHIQHLAIGTSVSSSLFAQCRHRACGPPPHACTCACACILCTCTCTTL